jgi:hypothetical protein
MRFDVLENKVDEASCVVGNEIQDPYKFKGLPIPIGTIHCREDSNIVETVRH